MEEGGGGEDMNIRVVVRCRPFNTKERNNGETSIVKITEGVVTLSNPAGNNEDHNFSFDSVFGPDCLQSEVWEVVGLPILDKAIAGYNGTIFAYGQTGSGKTWSMQGGEEDLRGIIPRMSVSLFDKVANEKQSRPTIQFLITVSYFEIYNEVIFDLLDASDRKKRMGNNKGGLEIKEHPALGVYVKGLQEMVVEDGFKLQGIIDQGMRNRTVASTQMNADSSRSHSVFMITVHQKDTDDESRNIFAKINLVDLAGSERVKSTGATGATLKEGANINKSLSALGNVINALVEAGKGKNTFIPYRNSKLTRVLQESLGGNSITTMLAALSPAACNFEETLSTLKYANRAKAIKVKAVKNEEASQVSRLNDEIRLLREKLMQQGERGDTGGTGVGSEKNQQQLAELEMALKNTWESKAKISKEYEQERNRLLQEQQAAAQQLKAAKERNWSLLEEKGQCELTISHVKEICNAANATTMEDHIDALQRQVLALETHEKKAQDQQSVCAVFRVALEKDIQALLQIKCTSSEHHNAVLIALRQVGGKAQALQEEILRWVPTVQHASKLLRDVRRSGEWLVQRIYGTFGKPGDDVREEVLRGLWLIVKQLRQREALAAQQLATVSATVSEAGTVRDGLQAFANQYEQAVKRDVVSWSNAEEVLKVLQEAVRSLKFVPSSSSSTAAAETAETAVDEALPYRLHDTTPQPFYVQTADTATVVPAEATESTCLISADPVAPHGGDPAAAAWDKARTLVLDLQETTTLTRLELLPAMIVNDPATRHQPNMDRSAEEDHATAEEVTDDAQGRGGVPETTTTAAAATAAGGGTATAAVGASGMSHALPTLQLPCGLSTSSLVALYRQQLDASSSALVPDDAAMEAIAKDTAQAMGDLLDWTVLLKQHDPIKFLRRPPVRFLFDLFQHLANQYKCCVSHGASGSGGGGGSSARAPVLLTPADWADVAASRETKTAYMDEVLLALQEEIRSVYVTDASTGAAQAQEEAALLLQAIQAHSGNSIVAGVDTEKTNRVLQLIALCAYRRHLQHTAKVVATTVAPATVTTTASGSSKDAHGKGSNGRGGAAGESSAGARSPGKGGVAGGTRRGVGPKYLVHVQAARVRVSDDGQQWREVKAWTMTTNSASGALSFGDGGSGSGSGGAPAVTGRFVAITVDQYTSEAVVEGGGNEPTATGSYLAVRARVLGHFQSSGSGGGGSGGGSGGLPHRTSLHARAQALVGVQSIWQRISESWALWTNVAVTTVHCDQQERSKRLDEARRRMEKEAAEQAQRAQSLASEKDALQTSNADLAAQLQQMVAQLLAAQQTIAELQENVQRRDEDCSHLREQVAQREQQTAALETQRLVLETALEKEKSAVGQLQSDLYDKEQALESAFGKLQHANKRCDELETERDELQQAMQVLQEERDTARQHEEELFERLGDVTADLERLQESYVDICDRCNDAQDEVSELRDQVSSLQETMKVLTQAKQQLQQQVQQQHQQQQPSAVNGHHPVSSTTSSPPVVAVGGRPVTGGAGGEDDDYDDDDGHFEASVDERAQEKVAVSTFSPQKKASKKGQPPAPVSSSLSLPGSANAAANGAAASSLLHSHDDSVVSRTGGKVVTHATTGPLSARSGGGDEDDYQEDFDDT